MKKLLEFILLGIVDKPKALKIQESEQDEVLTFTVGVAAEDMGKVIGRGGQIIKAIRTLLRVASAKSGKRVQILLEEKT